MELAARIGAFAATAGGQPYEKIVIENASTNMVQFSDEIKRILGPRNCFVVSVLEDTDSMRRNFPMAIYAIHYSPNDTYYYSDAARWRDGYITRAQVAVDYDADSRVGDEYWVIPVPLSVGGGINA